MARRARIILPGNAHHVTQRGNRKQKVFFCENDYKNYLKILKSNAETFNFQVWSYCLMPNHVHMLIVPESEDSLRDGISLLHQTYTRSVNDRKGWKGHLWQGRFFSCPVDPIGVPAVARYIELNPVRAGLCDIPSNYPWSSAQMSCDGINGRNGFAPIVAPGGTWSEYLRYDPQLENADELKRIRETARTGRPYASESFLVQLEKETGLALRAKKPGPKPKCEQLGFGRVSPN